MHTPTSQVTLPSDSDGPFGHLTHHDETFAPGIAGLLIVSSALSATPAQACLFGLPLLSNAPSCATGPADGLACPSHPRPGGRDADCLLHKRDLADDVTAMGSMAAGGMELVSGVLLGQADRAMRAIPPEQAF